MDKLEGVFDFVFYSWFYLKMLQLLKELNIYNIYSFNL